MIFPVTTSFLLLLVRHLLLLAWHLLLLASGSVEPAGFCYQLSSHQEPNRLSELFVEIRPKGSRFAAPVSQAH